MKNPVHQRLIDLLNQTLQVEYSFIIHYPRLAGMIQKEGVRNLILPLCTDSVRHADTVASVIHELGGEPLWDFEPFPERMPLVQMLQTQLEREKLALWLHTQANSLAPDPALKEKIRKIAAAEETHIKICEKILSQLAQGNKGNL